MWTLVCVAQNVEGAYFKNPEIEKKTNFSLFRWRASASAFKIDTLFLAYMFGFGDLIYI